MFDLHNPHGILGLHEVQGRKLIRLLRPGAETIHIELFGKIKEMKRVHSGGLFELEVPEHTQPFNYRIYHLNGLLSFDPYAFWPTFGQQDAFFFSQGVHYQLYEALGAHPLLHQNCRGVKFAVWAPSAKAVALVGDFNHWDGRVNPMRSMGSSGVWELFVPGLCEGEKYKFEIRGQGGDLKIKTDPYGSFFEMRPQNASIVWDLKKFQWNDRDWMEKRTQRAHTNSPISIYELHLGSWMKDEWRFQNYREIAHKLAYYCKEMGFTHVELMPVQEHPLDESWGYLVTGFFAPTSRFGTPEDFQYFVNHLHSQDIGIILDWTPAHFPRDDFSLERFDGSYLYEHEDPRQGLHPHWGSLIFNYGRKEVANFLIASALFWCEKMHIDGLRVDAVASMLYLDYGREEGQWIPNRYGGKKNLEAMEFIKHLNSIIHKRAPGVLVCAEESTSFSYVTKPVEEGGLGFDFKWNMGWMNDTLRYFTKEPIHRRFHQEDLTFGLIYAFHEKFTLVLSHDEVVHGKNSLLSKMPADPWQKFANVRLLYSYMICQPGKKLLFMGGELGQWDEWDCKGELHWFLLKYPIHDGLKQCVKEMNHFYLGQRALWEKDHDYTGFEWVDFQDAANGVLCYLRKSGEKQLLCVHHFTPNYFGDYFIRIGATQSIKEIFNTDDVRFGGSGKVNPVVEKNDQGIKIQLAPLATQIFEVSFES